VTFACRYVVGGRLLNIFTEFYLLSEVTNDGNLPPPDYLDINSPKWIGAWWLGFLLILVLSYLSAILLAFFPASLPKKDIRGVTKTTEEVVYYGHVKDLPKALYELVSNATYMFISLGASMDGFLLSGT
jgi:hypothetical protein